MLLYLTAYIAVYDATLASMGHTITYAHVYVGNVYVGNVYVRQKILFVYPETPDSSMEIRCQSQKGISYGSNDTLCLVRPLSF